MKESANQTVERMAAGGRRSRLRESWAAAIAHFLVRLQNLSREYTNLSPSVSIGCYEASS
jgi:hypothetical protein